MYVNQAKGFLLYFKTQEFPIHENQQKIFCFIGPALGPLDPILWTAHTEVCIHDHGATLRASAPDVTISTPVNPRPKLTNLRGSQPTFTDHFRGDS